MKTITELLEAERLDEGTDTLLLLLPGQLSKAIQKAVGDSTLDIKQILNIKEKRRGTNPTFIVTVEALQGRPKFKIEMDFIVTVKVSTGNNRLKIDMDASEMK